MLVQDIAADFQSPKKAMHHLQLSLLTPGDNTRLAAATLWFKQICLRHVCKPIGDSRVISNRKQSWTVDCGDPLKAADWQGLDASKVIQGQSQGTGSHYLVLTELPTVWIVLDVMQSEIGTQG